MGPRPWIALVVALLGALVVGVPSAYACPKDASKCSESGNISLSANSYGTQATDTTPTGSKLGAISIGPFSADARKSFDSNWETIVASFPKLGVVKNVFVRRVITCAIFARNVTDLYAAIDKRVTGSTSAKSTDTSQLFLTLCVQMVYATQRAMSTHIARSASAHCAMAVVSIPVQIKRSGGTYTAHFSATPSKAGRTPLAVSCRAKRSSTQIKMRPRARKRKLYKVIGNHMGIGFSNPSQMPVTIHSVFTFK